MTTEQAGAWQDHDGLALFHMTGLEALGGVAAIFTGRQRGVSPQWEGGLNWSLSVGDEPAAVAENRRLTLAALGLTPDRAVMAGLVHGDRVVAVQQGQSPEQAPGTVRVEPDCDALVTDQPGLALVVTAADCVPLFFYDPVRRVVGVAHAGWRGTVAGIGGKTARLMHEAFGCQLHQIHAAVGPSIGPCCYEVGPQVAEPVRAFYGPDADDLLHPLATQGKDRLDLWEANRRDLLRTGVGAVSVGGACTACENHRLFSHRGEAGKAGRGAAVIALR